MKKIKIFTILLLVLSLFVLAGCGEKEPKYTENLKFYLSEDGTYYIVDGFDGPSSYVYTKAIIPPTYKGLPVKRIAARAFKEEGLTTVVIPEGVEVIESFAFAECTELTSVTLPKSLKTISSGAFSKCRSLTEIELHENLEFIGGYSFEESKLSKIVIPSSVTVVDASAFNDLNVANFTIYCRSEIQPSGWHAKWNMYDYPVVWGYTE